MESFILNIDKKSLKEQIFKRFKELCGFFDVDEIDANRIDEAIDCFDRFFELFSIKSVFSENNESILKNFIDEKSDIYNDLKKYGIKKILPFAISAKSCDFNGSVLENFYFDITGTSIIDAVRNFMKNYFEEKYNGNISNSFGIGFFGIGIDKCNEFFKLIDCDKIDLSISKSGVLMPHKSFIGFFVVSEKSIYIKNDCKNCIGVGSGCFFCRNKK